MSERFIRLIPEDPTYVPSAADQQAAAQLLSRLLPDTREITTEVHDEVVFVDQGELFETIACPACDSPIQIDWWQDAMDEAYESRFSNLLVVAPCCDTTVSLNDLRYKYPAGFARFVLEVRGFRDDLADEVIAAISQVVGCRLRKIWVWY